jgi:MFS family permease
MQFLEFLIWVDQPKFNYSCDSGPHRGKLNNFASQFASIQNLLQPFCGGVLALIYIKHIDFPFPPIILIILLIIYAIIIIIWVFREKLYTQKLCTVPRGSCQNHHLKWPWLNKDKVGKYIWPAYYTMLLFSIIVLLRVQGGIILAGYLIITCIISMTIYPFKKASGSWWCVAAIGGPLLKLLLPSSNMNQKIF